MKLLEKKVSILKYSSSLFIIKIENHLITPIENIAFLFYYKQNPTSSLFVKVYYGWTCCTNIYLNKKELYDFIDFMKDKAVLPTQEDKDNMQEIIDELEIYLALNTI